MTRKDSKRRQRSVKQTSPGAAPKRLSAKPVVRWEELEYEEQLSVVCRLFCDGNNPTAIAGRIREDYGARTFTRQSTYPLLLKAANWSDEHSTFRKYMEKSADCSEVLVKAGGTGDMLWLPIGPDGPLDIQTKIRSMTLIELCELPRFIRKGRYVLLVLGPCAMCQSTKSQVLSAILASKQRLISHLVVDTGSAKEVLR